MVFVETIIIVNRGDHCIGKIPFVHLTGLVTFESCDVVGVQNTRNTYKILVGKPDGKKHF
jgi:hypothetical protein